MTKTTTVKEHRRRVTEAQGFALARRWRESGLTVLEFCRANEVGSHCVRYWNGRLRRQEDESTRSTDRERFVVMSAEELADNASATEDEEARDTIEIVVGDQFFVRVPQRAGALADVLRTLQEADR